MLRKTFLKSLIGATAVAAAGLPAFAEELMTRDGAVMLTGTILSNVGLAISPLAAEKKYVYLAS